MAATSPDLPEDCWELIFKRLDHHSHFEAPSLTCKRFLSITDDLRTHLRVLNPAIRNPGILSQLLRRFTHLKSIDLNELPIAYTRAVIEVIAQSGLIIESLNISNNHHFVLQLVLKWGLQMKGLRVLNCSDVNHFDDDDCIAIAKAMPWLEELDISSVSDSDSIGVSDVGVEALSLDLKGLRKVNVSGNLYLTDKSLLALSLNCEKLREIIALRCRFFTGDGFRFVLQNSRSLSSIAVEKVSFFKFYTNNSPVFDFHSMGRLLSRLEIYKSFLSDEFICAIARSGIPLKWLSLAFCINITLHGIVTLLRSYVTLEYLDLTNIFVFDDNSMLSLFPYIQYLVTLKLRLCPMLTESTLCMVASHCPFLEVLDMGSTNIGGGGGWSFPNVVKSSKMKFLNLSNNKGLGDDGLTNLASAFPSLEHLDVSSCSGITEEGIAEFLKSNSKVRHLQINECWGVKGIGPGDQLPNLEVLQAARSGINDQGLAMIGYRCCGLLKLDLEGCFGVTCKGLEEVSKNCKRLKEMNLMGFDPSNLRSLDAVVLASSSLRKLIVPKLCLPSLSRQNFYLLHGCDVCEG